MAAAERMCDRFPMPQLPEDEAWNYHEERFSDLLSPSWFVHSPMHELLSAIHCHGRGPHGHAVWLKWLHFIAPRMARDVADFRLEEGDDPVTNLFMALVMLSPVDFAGPPYKGYREDLLQTVGRIPMHESRWHHGQVRRGALFYPAWPEDQEDPWFWDWCRPADDLGSALYFCLKFMRPAEIPAWANSLLRIDDPHWRSQLMLWMANARSTILTPDWTYPTKKWVGASHVWGANLAQTEQALAPDNAAAFIATVTEHFRRHDLLDWWVSMAAHPYLEWAAWDTIDRFKSGFELTG